MSIPGPMKATSLTVRNTLHANETWIETLHVIIRMMVSLQILQNMLMKR